ncbi:hypothetical protein PIB30_034238, partial [Stylosanthes scabra]|nr:hypothetical protein [Stylosanthes scabra]
SFASKYTNQSKKPRSEQSHAIISLIKKLIKQIEHKFEERKGYPESETKKWTTYYLQSMRADAGKDEEDEDNISKLTNEFGSQHRGFCHESGGGSPHQHLISLRDT